MRISSTEVIEGERVLYSIGKINAASVWHAANGVPPQANWRELLVSELIHKAEDIDADAIIGFDYETDSIMSYAALCHITRPFAGRLSALAASRKVPRKARFLSARLQLRLLTESGFWICA
jgi:uncharacterized protein YbjQ (UPF0145 family)